jgi:hypothetical protein
MALGCQASHENRLACLKGDMAGLFLAVLDCPVKPAAARNNHSAFSEQVMNLKLPLHPQKYCLLCQFAQIPQK